MPKPHYKSSTEKVYRMWRYVLETYITVDTTQEPRREIIGDVIEDKDK